MVGVEWWGPWASTEYVKGMERRRTWLTPEVGASAAEKSQEGVSRVWQYVIWPRMPQKPSRKEDKVAEKGFDPYAGERVGEASVTGAYEMGEPRAVGRGEPRLGMGGGLRP